ncbi:MAG: aspartate-semialdehyde dehydrogenase [Crocinitomicaceae bacterium]|nr:aspartate-semialdehyde dehydrogenase [Crocinitomicaceae bacterium]
MKLAVIGCTGLVGTVILKVISECKLPISELILVASSKSIGKEIKFESNSLEIESIEMALSKNPEIAIFCAGGEISKKWAPIFSKNGITVIDNSSAWRMDHQVPLVVPEINGNSIKKSNKIIANPNCSTIQMVLALKEIHKRFIIDRIVVSTYQSVTGTGAAAVKQMMDERNEVESDKVYPHPIDKNCFPHGGDFLPNGYTTEEIKLVDETRKIFNSPEIKVTATVVRIPVIGGHSMAVNVNTKTPFKIEEIYDAFEATPGVIIKNDNLNFDYPMPLTAHERNEVFVGRIREDNTIENGLNMWIVADNLRKGAATNAVQIAEYLINNKLV